MAHLLLIDTDTEKRAATALMLRTSGHTVDEAEHVIAALSVLQHRPFDLVVSGLARCEQDSSTLRRTIHQRHPELPVITAQLAANLVGIRQAVTVQGR